MAKVGKVSKVARVGKERAKVRQTPDDGFGEHLATPRPAVKKKTGAKK